MMDTKWLAFNILTTGQKGIRQWNGQFNLSDTYSIFSDNERDVHTNINKDQEHEAKQILRQ